ncbi:type I polyketide synthase [Streptomyces sulphureus]|uniref:type I polyketide synthase n=1 Tax=Streptomyces sulphureus TaxID=47758 RepID=UPI00036922F7|nr:type I polyketide synthase [Streptomyces sulphureus]
MTSDWAHDTDGGEDHFDRGTDVAIVGMAGRFPGARDLDAFWANLVEGRESVAPLKEGDYLAAGGDPAGWDDPYLVKAASVVEGIDEFDAEYFGYPPAEAELLDPQQRLFLQCAHHTLERAGYGPGVATGPVGVYAGGVLSRYLLDHVHPRLRGSDTVALHHAQLGNVNSTLATRVSYELGLTGPSVAVQTACSTSLVAVHMACQDLIAHRCDMALAGGVALNPALRQGYRYVEDGPFSHDGHCRPFDADATGMTPGEGLGAVLVKRLEDALADGDHIHAVIKGSAVNNDGDRKVGFAAPSTAGQAEVIVTAMALAGVDAETVGYVEAHGTGTPVGDPIETAGLHRAFAGTTARRNYCALGSVKSNIGHTDAAAGIAGLLKAVLTLEHRTIPPTLHYRTPNPLLGLEDSPFYVPAESRPWENEGRPRRAGVSSLGIGGTNAHVVLEEAPPAARPEPAPRGAELLALSARTPEALDAVTAELGDHLRARPGAPLAAVAHTLRAGRRVHPYRRSVVAGDLDEASRQLSSAHGAPAAEAEVDPQVVFLLPGAGSQHPGMGRELYDTEPVYRAAVDRCAEILRPVLEHDLRDMLYGRDRPSTTGGVFPTLLATEYALATLLMSWGVRPAALLGHSLGEYTAACLAGVVSLEDVLPLVVRREELFARSAGRGGMLGVDLDEDAASLLLGDGLSLAAVNGPHSCVLAGPQEALDRAERKLLRDGVDHRRIRFGAAAHSSLLDPILGDYEAALSAVPLQTPGIPYVSNLTGTWITPQEAASPASWVRHTREPVRFGDGLRTLLGEGSPVLLEVGPGRALTGLVRAQAGPGTRVLPAMRHPRAEEPDRRALLDTVGRLWTYGAGVDLPALAPELPPRRVPLPGYPFARRRHWIAPHRPTGAAAPPASGDRGSFPVALSAQLPRMAGDQERLRAEYAARRLPARLTGLLDRLATAHVCAVLGEAGIDAAPGAAVTAEEVHTAFRTVPAYRPFVDALLRMLTDDGILTADGPRLRFTDALAEVPAPAALTREILDAHPDQAEDLAFLEHCVRHYRQVLDGTTAGTEVLLPDGSDERQRALIDRRLAFSDIPLHRRLVAETAARLAKEAGRRPVRILEIGAGRGYLTWSVAEELRGVPGTEYHFTDLGRSFALDGQRRAREEGFEGMEFGVLDITRDPAEQGYPPGGFDLVLAFNVLHATPDVRRAVRNAGSLLVPDGIVLLLEATRQQRWSLMTTGLYEGWWYFDDDVRTHSPLLAPDQWTRLLTDEGFADVTAFTEGGEADHALMAARRPDGPGGAAVVPAPARPFNRRPDLSVPYAPPSTDREKDVVRVWEEVLGIDGIGVQDNFFDLGGESLLAMQLTARLRDAVGADLPMRRIFETPTVAELIPVLEESASSAAPRIRPSARRSAAALPLSNDGTE